MKPIRILVLIILFPVCVFAQPGLLQERVSLRMEAVDMAEALDKLDQVSSYSFTYNASQLPAKEFTFNFQEAPLKEVLDKLVVAAGMQYTVRRNSIVIFAPAETTRRQHTISGYVQEIESGERLVGASVYDARSGRGTITNSNGYFSLTLPEDSVKLVVSSVGYAVQGERMLLSGDRRRLIRLKSNLELATVEINEEDEAVNLDDMSGVSVVRVPVSELNRLPALMGEPDVINILGMMPGVQSGSDNRGGLYVRGGGPDQNLILMDGVPIYNSAHLFGFYSIFNTDVLRNVELVKGGFPARYGGRLSSVLDLKVKDGHLGKLSGRGNLGLVSAKLMLEGPIIRDKTSFLISARRTILEPYWLVVNRLSEQREGNKLGYNFLDINGKIRHQLSERDQLALSFYTGGDRFSSGYSITGTGTADALDFGLRWGNNAGVLRWDRDWGDRLFSQLSFFTSEYVYEADSRSQLTLPNQSERDQSLAITSSVRDYGGRLQFDYLPGHRHFIRFGGTVTQHTFLPETFRQEILNNGIVSGGSRLQQEELVSWETTTFIEDNLMVTRRFRINAGIHHSSFMTGDTTYQSLQPRVSAAYQFPLGIRMQGAFSMMTQYLHLLSNSGVGLPTDLWVPATSTIPPQNSMQGSLGLEKRAARAGLLFSVEAYYKKMENLIDYQTGVNFLGNRNWQDIVERGGDGWSYGLECLLRKETGRLTGWVGYTLSRTERQFEQINFGNRFPYKYDRRHDVSTALLYKLNDHIEFSANWVYGTGAAITFPEAVYYAPTSPALGFLDLNDGQTVGVVVDYGDRNSFRLPAFHRLDLNVRINKKNRWGETFWNFGVFNVYNRKNPLFLFLRADYSANPAAPQIKARKMSLLPILPEVNFGFKF